MTNETPENNESMATARLNQNPNSEGRSPKETLNPNQEVL
jgi:hypothetical protein